MNGEGQNPPQRVFGLDVMRASAIVLVLVSHCGAVFAHWYGASFPQLLANGGMFGVEIFFVLSGYLVGRILLQTPRTPRAWRRFMIRRWLRTLPLYYLALAVLFWIWPPSFWAPDHARILLRAIPTYVLFLQNVAWSVGDHNWFGTSWSLAVEEWFYLGFSIVLLGLGSRIGRTSALAVTVAIALVGPAIVRGVAAPIASAPHSVVTALDQICIGVVMAWISLSAPARFASLSRQWPLGLVLCTLFWFEQRWIPAPIRQALWTDVLGAGIALCLPAAAAWRNAAGVLPGIVRAISVRSYGLYIVHLPVLEIGSFYRDKVPAPLWCHVAMAVAVIAILPIVSWACLERPLLRLGHREPREGWGDRAGPPRPPVVY